MRIKPTMAFERSLRKLVKREQRALGKLLKSVLQGEVESIHDFRAGIRRIRTLLGVAQGNRAGRLRKRAGKLAKLLGEVRDLDVTLGLAKATEFKGGRVSDWVSELESERDIKVKELEKSLDGKEVERWHAKVAHWTRQKEDGQNTMEGLRSALNRAVADARKQTHGISASELHRLRIAVKGTRYLVELFSEVLPANAQQVARDLELTQDAFGAYRDWTRFAEVAAGSPYGLELQGMPPKADQAHLARMASDALDSVATLLAALSSSESREAPRQT